MRNFARTMIALAAVAGALGTIPYASSAPSQQPLFLGQSVPPLMQIVMQRDHKLYYEAYNDASDLDGDGIPEIGFKPSMVYLGYFDSNLCYDYVSRRNRFEPSSKTDTMECSNKWSGNFLNYLTTSRMDALRRVLYGGARSTDTETATVLERSHIPQDAHSWGKEYESEAANGYDITKFTPLSQPASGKRHLFANLTPLNTSNPLLRVRTDSDNRIWEWISIERPVGGTRCINQDTNCSGTLTDYIVRVRVCVSGLLDAVCTKYGASSYKPTGLLQKYGGNESMYFGLLTGSYQNNLQGGVVRKNIGKFTDEIDAGNGTFKITAANAAGIVNTINRLRITGFGGNHEYNCGWITTRPINNGECQMWGNPLGEKLYEAMRYYAGQTPTPDFLVSENAGEENGLGLPVIGSRENPWKDPYKPVSEGGGGAEWCAKPFILAISDTYPSYDSDSLPGAHSGFSSFNGSLSSLNVSTEADKIWKAEGLAAGNYFIGQSGTIFDSAPTAKSVTGFSSIRGLAPEEPTKQGSYYSAAVAQWGRTNDVNAAKGAQKVQTFSVALASPLPRVVIPTKSGKKITVIPFSKSVSGSSINPAQGQFQPTNQLVDFYIDYIKNTDDSNKDANVNGGRPEYKFRINFEDVEQGADHDMDAIATYTVSLISDEQVKIHVSSDYAFGGIRQHMGYILSGTTNDGIKLVVRDRDDGDSASNDADYFLDDGYPRGTGNRLPLTSEKTFTAGATNASFIPHDPLWYAAKYGGFNDSNSSNTLDSVKEWDADGDGAPDNYYLVTNPARLYEQLDKAFAEVIKRSASFTLLALNSARISTETRLYQASFNAENWTGELRAFKIKPDGSVGEEDWAASNKIPASGRKIFSWKYEKPSSATNHTAEGIDFSFDNLSSNQRTRLGQAPAFGSTTVTDDRRRELIDYIRGDRSKEGENYRQRDSLLGDIVNSDPTFGGNVDFGYDRLPANQGGGTTYLTYLKNKRAGAQTVFVGANDGMLHAFDAKDGKEIFAFIPDAVIPNLKKLADTSYATGHHYFVDGPLHYGDAYLSSGTTSSWKSILLGSTGAGGKSIFALDVTKPASFSASNVMWEFSHAELGFTLSRPVIAKMANGRWAAITGNGPNSGSGNAKLFIIYLDPSLKDPGGWEAGTDFCVLNTDTTGGNGLGSPKVVNSGAGTAQYIYAGDLAGRMWRFNVAATGGNCPSGWTPSKVFTATNGNGETQAITAAPQIDIGPQGGYMVVFGTGKYYESADQSNLDIQSLYGVLDPLESADQAWTRGNLVAQTITGQTTKTVKNGNDSYSWETRDTSSNPVDFASKKGWYLDLVDMSSANNPRAAGERVIATPQLIGNVALFTTLIPQQDACGGGADSWLIALDYRTGSATSVPFFDLNNDGVFNATDRASGLKFGLGGAPAILTKPDGGTVADKQSGDTIENVRLNSGRLISSWRQIK